MYACEKERRILSSLQTKCTGTLDSRIQIESERRIVLAFDKKHREPVLRKFKTKPN